MRLTDSLKRIGRMIKRIHLRVGLLRFMRLTDSLIRSSAQSSVFSLIRTSASPSVFIWFRRRLKNWGNANFRDFPWRRTADPYRLLVAECLLQKTTASQVQPIYEQVLEKDPEVEDLAIASGTHSRSPTRANSWNCCDLWGC